MNISAGIVGMGPSAPPEAHNLALRIVSALILLPLAVGSLALGGVWFGLFATLGLAAGVAEWVMLTSAPAVAWPIGIGVAGVIGVASTTLVAGGSWGFLALAVATVVALAWSLAARQRWSWGAVPYLGASALALIWLRETGTVGFERVLWLLLVIWATDVGGYVFGRLIGGAKLAPTISPKKTWAGALGGLAAAGVLAVVVDVALGLHDGLLAGPVAACFTGIVVSIVAQAGDLAESAWKRRFDAKDSGRLIPGHGGMLDRIDGMLAAAPLFALGTALVGGA